MQRAQEGGGKAYDKMVKILLIGNSGVGKSSILLQYNDKKFAHNYYNTIGVDYRIKFLNIKGIRVKLQVWDTAGQDRFKTITSSYYRGADGIIIVYDMTDRQSFDNVKTWLQEIEKYVDERTKKYIVGNKSDLQQRRQIQQEQAENLTSKLGIPYKETSARLAINVESVFEELISDILDSQGGSNYASRFSRQNTQTYQSTKQIRGPSSKEASPQQKNKGQNLTLKQMLQKKKQQANGGCCAIY